MTLLTKIANKISEITGSTFELASCDTIGGGCISTAYRLIGLDGRSYFVKTHTQDHYEMFAAEAEGLIEMAQTHSIKVPQPLVWDVESDHAWLVMDYIPLTGRGSAAKLGQQLAAMHRTSQTYFGWHRDNTIGSTPQVNTLESDWIVFWREHRLRFQLQLAANNGFRGRLQDKGEQLLENFHHLFDGVSVVPSLLHGDLWSGNYSFSEKGEPLIFDPAVYYGDREADIAMTELFGGFGRDFYDAYNAAWPLDGGYRVRKTLYNLYHILNHANLFGGGYASQAEGMIDRLLSEV